MRILLATVLLTVLMPGPVTAQLIDHIGLKAGLAYSDIEYSNPRGDFELSDGHRLGFSVIGFAERQLTALLHLVAEVGYVQRGFEDEFEVRDARGQDLGMKARTYSFDYLTIAPIAKVQFSSLSPRLYTFLGPHLNLLLDSRTRSEAEVFFGSESDYELDVSNTAIGGTFGLGVVLSPLPLQLEARYSRDFTDSFKDVPAELRNTSVDVLLGVRF